MGKELLSCRMGVYVMVVWCVLTRVGDVLYTKMCGFCIRCVILCELKKGEEYNRFGVLTFFLKKCGRLSTGVK